MKLYGFRYPLVRCQQRFLGVIFGVKFEFCWPLFFLFFKYDKVGLLRLRNEQPNRKNGDENLLIVDLI